MSIASLADFKISSAATYSFNSFNSTSFFMNSLKSSYAFTNLYLKQNVNCKQKQKKKNQFQKFKIFN